MGWRRMGIPHYPVQGFMPQNLHDRPEIHTSHGQVRRCSVTQIMEPEIRDAGLNQSLVEALAEIIWVSVPFAKDIWALRMLANPD